MYTNPPPIRTKGCEWRSPPPLTGQIDRVFTRAIGGPVQEANTRTSLYLPRNLTQPFNLQRLYTPKFYYLLCNCQTYVPEKTFTLDIQSLTLSFKTNEGRVCWDYLSSVSWWFRGGWIKGRWTVSFRSLEMFNLSFKGFHHFWPIRSPWYLTFVDSFSGALIHVGPYCSWQCTVMPVHSLLGKSKQH